MRVLYPYKLVSVRTCFFGLVFVLCDVSPLLAECIMPEMVSFKAVFSENCSLASYSSNKEGRIRPYLLDLSAQGPPGVEKILIDGSSADYNARDLSPDCNSVAIVKNTSGVEQYQVHVYDRAKKEMRQISDARFFDASNPIFSPVGNYLAYSSVDTLVVYDLLKGEIYREFKAANYISSYVWSLDGLNIYYQDSNGYISNYGLAENSSKEIWHSPIKTYSPSTLSVSNDKLYFVSDYDRGYSQIYSLDLANLKVVAILPEDRDQSSPDYNSEGLFFKYSDKGKICLRSLAGNTIADQLNCEGVVYSYAVQKDRVDLVYSDPKRPISVFSFKKAGLKERLGISRINKLRPPQDVGGNQQIPDFLFAGENPTTSLVVLIHGGPNENVSPRYNPYISNLVSAGHDVLALNYIGSTGAGNSFELLGMESKEVIERQVLEITKSIKEFRKKYPQYTRLSLLSISYGSNLVHCLRQDKSLHIDRVVDFSGKTDLSSEAVEELKFDGSEKTLFIWGTEDYFYPFPERQKLLATYREKSKPIEITYENEGHVIRSRERNTDSCNAIVDFLSK